MNIRKLYKKYYAKYGRKALVVFIVYFVTKWTLTIVFGAQLISFFKEWIN